MKKMKWIISTAALTCAVGCLAGCSLNMSSINLDIKPKAGTKVEATVTLSDINIDDFNSYGTLNNVIIYYAYDDEKKSNFTDKIKHISFDNEPVLTFNDTQVDGSFTYEVSADEVAEFKSSGATSWEKVFEIDLPEEAVGKEVDYLVVLDGSNSANVNGEDFKVEQGYETPDKIFTFPAFNYTPAFDATCETAGNIAYLTYADGNYYTDTNRTLLTDQNGDNVVDEKDVIIPATGHKWKYSSKTNNTDGSLTVTFACENDAEHTQSIKLSPQNIIYIRTITGATPTWVWANDNSSASLSFGSIPEEKAAEFAAKLGIDESLALYFAHNGITVPATITQDSLIFPSCTEKGTKTLTAHVNSLTNTETVELPALGHEIKDVWSWTKTDDGYKAKVIHKCARCGEGEEINAVVSSAEIDGKIVYTATAEVEGETIISTKEIDINYTFAVEGGTITSGEKTSYNYGDAVTVKADAKQEGKFFSGWYIGDTLITTQQSYTFYVKSQNMTVTAKYEGNAVAEENADVSVIINRTDIENSRQKVVFSLNWALPQGCKLKEAGILRRYDNAENLTFDKVDGTTIKRHASTLKTRTGNCNFTLTVSETTKLRSINSVAYIIYTDNAGTEHTVLKPVVTSNYNA